MQINNLKYSLITLAVLALMVGGYDVLAQSNYTPVTQGGNSGNPLGKLQLAPKGEDADGNNKRLSEQDFIQIDPLNPDLTRNFRLYGSSVFDNLTVTGEAYFNKGVSVGFDEPVTFAGGDPLLQVNGYILIQELAHPDCVDTASCMAIPDENLCVNDYGIVQRCTI